MGRYILTDTLRLRPDSVLISLHPDATQLVLPTARRRSRAWGAEAAARGAEGGSTIVIGVGLYRTGINPGGRRGSGWRARSR